MLQQIAHLSIREIENRTPPSVEGRDLHRAKAAEIFGIPESEVTPYQRRFAKQVNYVEWYSPSK